MSEESRPSPSISDFAEIIGLAVAAGFVVSVAYDWGYFRSFDLGFLEVPTTVGDHVRTGLLWFPPLVAIAILYLGLEFHFRRVERGLTEEEIISASKRPEALRKFREWPYKVIFLFCVFGLSSYVFLGDVAAALMPLCSAVLWMAFASWCYDAPLIRMRRSWKVQLVFLLLPAVLFFSFYSGKNAARSALGQNKQEVTVQLTANGQSIDGVYLRSLTSSLVILGPGETIEVIPWGAVVKYKFKIQPQPYLGLLCTLFGKCPGG